MGTPPLNGGAIGEGEYIDAGGDVSVALSVLSYRALLRYDSTLFDLDSTNAVAIAWVRDTLQDPITDADVVLYVDSVLPVPMVYVDTLEAYVASIPSFFGHFYIADVRTDNGYLRARLWNPTVGVDSVQVNNTPVLLNDTVDAPDSGDVIIYALFPLDDRPVVILDSYDDSEPAYAPYVILVSVSSEMGHSAHVKVARGFTSTRDTIVFNSQMVERLFPYSHTTYELYIIVANMDTTAQIPPIDPCDVDEEELGRVLEIMNHAGVMTISDMFRFYVVR